MSDFVLPTLQSGYTPSPQKPTIYSGPTVPTTYDPDWQYFINLTPDQVAWFKSRPEWQNFLAYVALSPKAATVGTPTAVVSGALAVAKSNPAQTALFTPPKL